MPPRAEPPAAAPHLSGTSHGAFRDRPQRCPSREFLQSSTLECPPLAFLRDELAGAHRERHDRPGGILVSLGDEGTAVGDEKVFHVVRSAVRVESGFRRIAAHANGAELVDDLSTPGDSIAFALVGHLVEDLASHLLDERAESLLHVPNLVVLIVRPLPVKTKDRNSVLVLHRWIELAVAAVVRNHLAAPGEVDLRSVESPVFILE